MARMEINESVMTLAVSKSSSLRTTIPRHIVQKLNLNPGDVVIWDLDKTGKRWIASVQKK